MKLEDMTKKQLIAIVTQGVWRKRKVSFNKTSASPSINGVGLASLEGIEGTTYVWIGQFPNRTEIRLYPPEPDEDGETK